MFTKWSSPKYRMIMTMVTSQRHPPFLYRRLQVHTTVTAQYKVLEAKLLNSNSMTSQKKTLNWVQLPGTDAWMKSWTPRTWPTIALKQDFKIRFQWKKFYFFLQLWLLKTMPNLKIRRFWENFFLTPVVVVVEEGHIVGGPAISEQCVTDIHPLIKASLYSMLFL